MVKKVNSQMCRCLKNNSLHIACIFKISILEFQANPLFFISEPRLDKNPFGNGFGPPGGPAGLNPMAAQFMALQHPAFLSAAQVNAAGGMPAPFGLPNPSVVTSSPSIPGRPEPQFMKGPNAASLASLEALQRFVYFFICQSPNYLKSKLILRALSFNLFCEIKSVDSFFLTFTKFIYKAISNL